MDPNKIEPILTAVKARQSRPAHRPSSDEPQEDAGGLAVLLAGAVRAFLYTLKRRAVSGFVRKRAFITLGKRTNRSAVIAAKTEGSSQASTSTAKPSVIPFGKVAALLKNVTIGLSVFFTYEYVVDYIFLSSSEKEAKGISSQGDDGGEVDNSASEMKPLVAHVCAGACAGLAQTTVLTAWEILGIMPRSALANPTAWLGSLSIDKSFFARRMVHHAVGYASLFGCFELFRRQLLQRFHDHLASGSKSVPIVFDELERRQLIKRKTSGNLYDVTPVTLTAAFLAGGLAGQVHHIVSHYTSHWKMQALEPTPAPAVLSKPTTQTQAASTTTETKASKVGQKLGNILVSWGKKLIKNWVKKELKSLLPRPPTMRSTMGSFGPSALCFVAFQYGGELTARMVDEDRASRPFPVLFRPG